MTETDQALLGRYAREGCEDAFAEIVRRHVDLVYAVALREVRSPQLAEEIVQAVFQDLARQARRLRADTAVAGWLHLVAYRTAVDAIRREARRHVREETAIEMNALNAAAEPWPQIEPLLDAAVAALSPNDRAAVVLRYFENRPLREVGDALNISEDAAQKRVGRAVERLRDFLAGRGVCVSVGGLTTLVTANAVVSAPASLAGTVLSAILVSGEATAIAVGTATATGWLTAKTTTAVLALGLVAGSGTLLHQQRELHRVQNDLSNAWATNNVLTETVEKTQAALDVQAGELEQRRKDQTELARLRNRVGQLQRELEDFSAPGARPQLPSTNASPRGAQTATPRSTWPLGEPRWPNQFGDQGLATPQAAAETVLWAAQHAQHELIKMIHLSDESLRQYQSEPRAAAEGIEDLTSYVRGYIEGGGGTQRQVWLTGGEREDGILALTALSDSDVVTNNYNNVVAFRVTHRDDLRDNTSERFQDMRFYETGGQWKLIIEGISPSTR
jgi:RNA polymerase sigma factor (sigma-70 family)